MANGLKENPRVLTLIVTHFPQVAKSLEGLKDENGKVIFKNYQMNKQHEAKFILNDGIFESSYDNALKIARNSGFLK